MLAVVACLYLISGLDPITLIAFAIWLVVAMVYYVTYARLHSRLAQPTREGTP